MRQWSRWGLVAGVVLSLGAGQTVDDPSVVFERETLDNGLQVLVVEDHTAPVVSIAVNYLVGSRDERPGRTGFAHLFEHMMFKGSENVGSGEHFVLVHNNGGDVNGTTNKDRTLYFERLPANQLELGLFLEADRMRSLEITQENLDNQRQAVQEERRLRVDNQPYGRTSFEAVDELAYDSFAYSHSIIGSMEDLSAATVEDVAEFFEVYYAPNNAVLAIVGDVNPERAFTQAREYFGSIPRQPEPPPVDVSEPPQGGERRLELTDALARLPRVDVAYRIPRALDQDHDALSVLATILASGRSSRLYQAVVRGAQVGVSVAAYTTENRGPNLFRLIGIGAPGRAIDEVEAALYEEVDRLKRDRVEPWELQKARNGARRGFVTSLGSSLQRAILLSRYALFYDDPDLINTRAARIASITAEDLRRVARSYLTADSRSVVVTRPAPAGGVDPEEDR